MGLNYFYYILALLFRNNLGKQEPFFPFPLFFPFAHPGSMLRSIVSVERGAF